MAKLKCVIMRGGTSKGVFFHENELPENIEERTKTVLRVLGSPDKRQIDGLGGADILTSKIAIVGPPSRKDADVDYIFGQVGITEPIVDWGTICGNLSAAVGPFAVDEGLVRAREPRTTVKVFCKNVGKYLSLEFETCAGKAVYEGNYAIDGVPGTGSKISLDYSDTAGILTGSLLPTGNRKDVLEIKNIGPIEATIIDVSTPVVFIRARDLGLTGTETAREMDADRKLIESLEHIRLEAARIVGLEGKSAFMPMLALVQEPVPWTNFITGEPMRPEGVTIMSKVYAAGMMHKAYPGTGCVTTGVAAKLKGSIVDEFVSPEDKDNETVIIGHFSGVISVDVRCRDEGGIFELEKAIMYRTARRIMEGYVYV
ncbi:MAG TPA: PrpF domain-containing protein [Syntrophorhabdaceae bacterium]|nr:PrpF domain-containing protein [Syntrophorhabdaceae bacterium]